MVKKVAIIFFLIIFALIAVFAGIIFLKKKNSNSVAKKTITLGWNEWPGNLPYLIAFEKGFFKDEGINVQLKKEDSYGAMTEDLSRGAIDCSGSMSLIDVISEVAKGEDFAVVGVTDYSAGADGIVSHKNIKSVDDLKGKKIAVEKGTLGEFLLIEALRQHGLTMGDVDAVNLSAQDAAAAFISGKTDAAVTYEPYLSEAAKDGNKIFTSADSPYLIVDTLVFHKSFVNTEPQTVQAVLNAYFRAVEYIKNNSDEAYSIGAQYLNTSIDKFKTQVSGLDFLDKNENLIVFSHMTGKKSLYVNGGNLLIFLKELGMISGEINLDDVILRRFVKSLAY